MPPRPPRLSHSVLRAVSRSGRAPVLGKVVCGTSVRLLGIEQLRTAKLGAAEPWVPATPPPEAAT